MLYSIDSDDPINSIPHSKDYHRWRNRLTDAEYQEILDEINHRISQNEVVTSSWVPGSDWTGTPFEPIYTKACLNDEEQSGLCFGLFFFAAMMERPDDWLFKRSDVNEIPIRGLTYFRIHR